MRLVSIGLVLILSAACTTEMGSGRPGGGGGDDDELGGTDGGVGGGDGAPLADARPLPPVDPSCGLPDAAFCENFETKSPGGRGGDLDDARWNFARIGFAGSEGANMAFVPTRIDLCGEERTVPFTEDSQFCATPDGDRRWVEAFDDNGGFIYNAGRVRQAFDFAGRTGTVQFESDAKSSGSHGWWIETWITDGPISGPNHHDPQIVSSANAVGFVFSDQGMGRIGPGTEGSGYIRLSELLVVNDFGVRSVDFEQGDLLRTRRGVLNKFQLRVSETHVEVWGSDEGSTALKKIASADTNLGFSRGYVSLTHVHYNAVKTNEADPTYTVTPYQTYHWARVAFDGPQLPTPRAYGIDDPLMPVSTIDDADDARSIGYVVSNDQISMGPGGPTDPISLTFHGVDPTEGVSGRITMTTVGLNGGDDIRFRFNRGTWRTWHVPDAMDASWERQSVAVPISVEDLVAGDNVLELGTSSDPFFLPSNSMYAGNIDLEIEQPR